MHFSETIAATCIILWYTLDDLKTASKLALKWAGTAPLHNAAKVIAPVFDLNFIWC